MLINHHEPVQAGPGLPSDLHTNNPERELLLKAPERTEGLLTCQPRQRGLGAHCRSNRPSTSHQQTDEGPESKGSGERERHKYRLEAPNPVIKRDEWDETRLKMHRKYNRKKERASSALL